MLNLNTITFEPAPANYSANTYNTQLFFEGDNTTPTIIIGLDLDSDRAGLDLNLDGKWFSSDSTQDWPALDRTFGRKNWQAFLAQWEAETLAEFAEDDE